MKKSEKMVITLLLLLIFLGCFGLHRFYTNKVMSGIFFILTCGMFGIWFAYDFFLIVTGKFTDEKGLYITKWI